MTNDLDFTISSIQHVIERTSDSSWNINESAATTCFILGLSLDGQANYTIDGSHYMIHKGDLILLPPGCVRAARSDLQNPWHFISLGCELQFKNEYSRRILMNLPRYYPDVSEIFVQKYCELSHTWIGKRTGYLIKCRSLLLDLFYELLQTWDSQRFKPSHYDRIIMVQEYIQTHCQHPLSLTELAALSGFSTSHFRRLFHSVTGLSCMQYANLVRISIAKNMLLSGSSNVSEAAAATGFSDIYYFSKVFKKITGHSPSYYKL